MAERKRVAVIGAGVSGLGATWLLNEHSPHEVHLFEKGDYFGGHTHTVAFHPSDRPEKLVNVDTGFIVCNTVTYPNLLRFFKLRNLPLVNTDMSFSVSRDQGAFEWAGHSLSAFLANPLRALDPSHWRMAWDIIRFNACAVSDVLINRRTGSIGEYLRQEGYSDAFRDNYLMPMTAAIWSTPPDQAALDFPAITLVRFLHNHHLLQVFSQPQWLTVRNGSKTYVDTIISRLPGAQRHLNTGVAAVSGSSDDGFVVTTESGEEHRFDFVILATHAPTALKLLSAGGGATKMEKRVLRSFQTLKNSAVLHSDADLMPRRRSTWSAWNILSESKDGVANHGTISLTYWMNLLQSIDEEEYGSIFVTLNAPRDPDPATVIGKWPYDHPLYTAEAVNAQDMLPSISGPKSSTARGGLAFAGAWTAYGFHEDGFSSGLRAATAAPLFAKSPFEVTPAERIQRVAISDRLVRLVIEIIEWTRRVWSPLVDLVLLVSSLYLIAIELILRSVEGRNELIVQVKEVRGYFVQASGAGRRSKEIVRTATDKKEL